ncbi:Z1 domain-containing protein [Cellulomonas sp. NPDC057328]|uniref:Z1 domain-containing protein n=1 Tax=Cellulomonas sp. NPDC057328 TaxID=3346101 RepID=UPI00363086DD
MTAKHRLELEHVRRVDAPAEQTWWSAYEAALVASGIGTRSREVLEIDAEHVVERGIFGSGQPGDARWPASRERRGLVMGAVQSGKTASMMAVAAKALDRGVDALVILGGTRTALWAQTFERLRRQLDTLERRDRRRELMPRADLLAAGGGTPADFYALPLPRARRLVAKQRPLIAVVMKNVAHLEQMSTALADLYEAGVEAGRPFHVLVIDDEADDSSVVDAAAEAGDEWDFARRKQVPLRILDLWESRSTPGETRAPHVYATYVAYTATPQANFLQDPSNPLAPRDFVASLRTPGPDGVVEERSSSFRVPEGPRGWYTGGEIFYKTLASVPLCVAVDEEDADEVLRDAVRAYLVACAARIERLGVPFGPRTARETVFADQDQAKALPPMSMLVHPTSTKEGHFEAAHRLLAWSSRDADEPLDVVHEAEGRYLDAGRLTADLDESPDRWRRWLEEYARSSGVCADALGAWDVFAVPTPDRWEEIRRLLVEEVIPGTAVAVINSDEQADDRPDFSPRRTDDGWRAPRNLSTIFVSGNVMARGLTLEGLSTTLFTRSSSNPLADTQMQMQRWFGYRGDMIDLCRVFMNREQVDLFTAFHENDEALRRDVLVAMSGDAALPDVEVLQGRAFRATGKIANVRGVSLFPGARPFVRHLTPAAVADANTALMADVFSSPVVEVEDQLRRQGLLLAEPLDLVATADLLDRLSYDDHGPGPAGPEASRWASVGNHAELTEADRTYPLYRAPSVEGGVELGNASPYAIAAYLRTWAACLDRRVPGMVTTDEPPVLWSLVDLEGRRRRAPRFHIGLRFGNGAVLDGGPLGALPFQVRPMARALSGKNEVGSAWGSRNADGGRHFGDEFFDARMLGLDPVVTTSGARPEGSDGLVLFHLIDRGEGRVSLAVGLNIPLGGPDHVAATVGGIDA